MIELCSLWGQSTEHVMIIWPPVLGICEGLAPALRMLVDDDIGSHTSPIKKNMVDDVVSQPGIMRTWLCKNVSKEMQRKYK